MGHYAYVGYGTVIAVTDAAILVDIGGDEHWFPKSQLYEDCDLEFKNDSGDVIIAQWLADSCDLEYDKYED